MSIYEYQEQLLGMQYHSADSMTIDSLVNPEKSNRSSIPVSERYLSQALIEMRKSHSMDLIIKHCIKSKVRIYSDSLIAADDAIFYEKDNQIHVSEQNKTYNADIHNVRMGQIMIGLATGLRKAWHFHKGNGFHPELCVPDLLHICRSANADIIVFVTLICWELKEKGIKNPWKQWISGVNSDVAEVFENIQLECGGTKDENALNKALQAAYRQWFSREDRGAESEHIALEKLDKMLITHRRGADCLEGIGKNQLTVNLWSRLGEIPGRQNYLKQKKLLKYGYRKEPIDAFNKIHFQHVIHDLENI